MKSMPSSSQGASPAPKPSAAVYARYFVLVAIGLPLVIIAIYFVGMLKTAEAREITAACNSLQPASQSKKYKSFPVEAKQFALKNYRGETVSLADYRGRVVLVNFWASWCKTCRSEKPSLEAMASELAGDGVEVLALASDPDWNLVRGALPNGSNLTVLLDPPVEGSSFGGVATDWGIKAVPETFVIDRNGVIRHYLVNKRDWKSSVARTCIEALAREG